LNLEPFISPALYEAFNGDAVDEWTLSELIMQRDGNLNAIEEHYKTFIVEEDFAQIAAAGLNWIRLPLPFWAIETYPGEPHLPKVSWQYFLKAIKWARKYGLRINLDFHALPGSQNGWNHSGKLGQVNFLNGAMGFANAQRGLDYIRILAEFISQPEYRNVVPFFGIMNEPRSGGDFFSQDTLASFYAEAYRIIRTAGGMGPGNGPIVSIHEGFQGLANWASYFPGADRIALDSHPYLAFGGMSADPVEAFIPLPCNTWSGVFGDSQNNFGLTGAGEWSHAINDCGLYLNAVGVGTRYEGTFESGTRIGSCDQWIEYENWSQSTKESLRQFSLSTMDALQNWFFWTWKIGESSTNNKVQAPFWSYKLGLQEGWTPTDPRESQGQCQRVGGTVNPYSGTLANNWAQGGTSNLDSYAWPPATIGGGFTPANAAVYTATGPLITLPVPTSTESGATATPSYGDGWANNADQGLMHVPIAGCTYPDPWDALTAAVPACAVGVAAKRDVAPGPTPMA
jgi:glucan 1,3-beta-glucosidase